MNTLSVLSSQYIMLLSVVAVIELFVCSVAKLENLGLKIIQAKLKICDLPLLFSF